MTAHSRFRARWTARRPTTHGRRDGDFPFAGGRASEWSGRREAETRGEGERENEGGGGRKGRGEGKSADLSRRDATVVRRLAGFARDDDSRRDARRVPEAHNRQAARRAEARRGAPPYGLQAVRAGTVAWNAARANAGLPVERDARSKRKLLACLSVYERARARARTRASEHPVRCQQRVRVLRCAALYCAVRRVASFRLGWIYLGA